MNVRIQLFAVAKQLAGQDWAEIDLPEGATISRLRQELARQVPALAGIVDQLKFAIDAEFALDETVIASDSNIACIPPVSGG